MLTSCSNAKPEESLLIYKSKDKDLITIQKMNSGKRDTIFLNHQKNIDQAITKWHLENKAREDINTIWGEQTNRYVKHEGIYYLDNSIIPSTSMALIILLLFVLLYIYLRLIVAKLLKKKKT